MVGGGAAGGALSAASSASAVVAIATAAAAAAAAAARPPRRLSPASPSYRIPPSRPSAGDGSAAAPRLRPPMATGKRMHARAATSVPGARLRLCGGTTCSNNRWTFMRTSGRLRALCVGRRSVTRAYGPRTPGRCTLRSSSSRVTGVRCGSVCGRTCFRTTSGCTGRREGGGRAEDWGGVGWGGIGGGGGKGGAGSWGAELRVTAWAGNEWGPLPGHCCFPSMAFCFLSSFLCLPCGRLYLAGCGAPTTTGGARRYVGNNRRRAREWPRCSSFRLRSVQAGKKLVSAVKPRHRPAQPPWVQRAPIRVPVQAFPSSRPSPRPPTTYRRLAAPPVTLSLPSRQTLSSSVDCCLSMAGVGR